MKTAEECYNEATLKNLGDNSQGTRQDVIYLAMEIYANQFKSLPQQSIDVPSDEEIDSHFAKSFFGDTTAHFSENTNKAIGAKWMRDLLTKNK